jgi:shikimate kinase
MGAGKSTAGKILASRMQVDFVDLDEAIVHRAGKSVSELFGEEGEAFFRKLEKEELVAQSASPTKVLACGGGVVLDKENVRVLRDNFYVFYLEISEEEAVKRLSRESGRPLLIGQNIRETVTGLMAQRSEIYSNAANEVIEVNDLTAEQVAEELFIRCAKLRFKRHENRTRS